MTSQTDLKYYKTNELYFIANEFKFKLLKVAQSL